MKAHMRVARPTDNLAEMLKFYRDGLGFEVGNPSLEFCPNRTDHEHRDGNENENRRYLDRDA